MSNPADDFAAAVGRLMNDPNYIKMLLGIAISRLPDGLEVAADDYDKLVGKGLVLAAGSRPNTYKLILKPLPTEQMDIPTVGVVGEA